MFQALTARLGHGNNSNQSVKTMRLLQPKKQFSDQQSWKIKALEKHVHAHYNCYHPNLYYQQSTRGLPRHQEVNWLLVWFRCRRPQEDKRPQGPHWPEPSLCQQPSYCSGSNPADANDTNWRAVSIRCTWPTWTEQSMAHNHDSFFEKQSQLINKKHNC